MNKFVFFIKSRFKYLIDPTFKYRLKNFNVFYKTNNLTKKNLINSYYLLVMIKTYNLSFYRIPLIYRQILTLCGYHHKIIKRREAIMHKLKVVE